MSFRSAKNLGLTWDFDLVLSNWVRSGRAKPSQAGLVFFFFATWKRLQFSQAACCYLLFILLLNSKVESARHESKMVRNTSKPVWLMEPHGPNRAQADIPKWGSESRAKLAQAFFELSGLSQWVKLTPLHVQGCFVGWVLPPPFPQNIQLILFLSCYELHCRHFFITIYLSYDDDVMFENLKNGLCHIIT